MRESRVCKKRVARVEEGAVVDRKGAQRAEIGGRWARKGVKRVEESAVVDGKGVKSVEKVCWRWVRKGLARVEEVGGEVGKKRGCKD